MRLRHDTTEQHFVEQVRKVEAVLRRAVCAALTEHKRAGNPVAESRNGEVVVLTPEQVPLDRAEGERTSVVRADQNG